MKVSVYQLDLDENSHAYVIQINDEERLSFFEGNCEDNNLIRNFNDVTEIPDLLELVFEAGQNGEDLRIDYVDGDPDLNVVI